MWQNMFGEYALWAGIIRMNTVSNVIMSEMMPLDSGVVWLAWVTGGCVTMAAELLSMLSNGCRYITANSLAGCWET